MPKFLKNDFNKYECTVDQELADIAAFLYAGLTLPVRSIFLHEMTSWPPS